MRLGVYEITAYMDDGIGHVYRARDTTLDRDVATAVEPTGATDDTAAELESRGAII
jgi:hypothetical protein